MAIERRYESIARPRAIVVATNLIDIDSLLPLAIAQSKAVGARLTLLHSYFNSAIPSISAEGLMCPAGIEDVKEYAECILSESERCARAEGIVCDSVVRPCQSVIEALRDELFRTGAERIIISGGERGLIRQFIFGSVIGRMMCRLGVPICAVGPKVHVPVSLSFPHRILHPISWRGDYQESLAAVRRLAELNMAELVLIQVVDPQDRERISSVQDLIPSHAQFGNPVGDSPALIVDSPCYVNGVNEVLQGVSRFEADWLVLGWDERQRNSIFSRNAICRMIKCALVPVLVFPHHLSECVVHTPL